MIESPNASPCTFLDFPLINDLDSFQANVAILGIPFGMPYEPDSMANDQSRLILSFLSLPSMQVTFSETLIQDSRSFFLANQLLSVTGQPFDINDHAQPLFSQRLYLFRC